MTAPADITPETFYAMTKQAQADLIYKALFVERSPLSEACRGIGKFPFISDHFRLISFYI